MKTVSVTTVVLGLFARDEGESMSGGTCDRPTCRHPPTHTLAVLHKAEVYTVRLCLACGELADGEPTRSMPALDGHAEPPLDSRSRRVRDRISATARRFARGEQLTRMETHDLMRFTVSRIRSFVRVLGCPAHDQQVQDRVGELLGLDDHEAEVLCASAMRQLPRGSQRQEYPWFS